MPLKRQNDLHSLGLWGCAMQCCAGIWDNFKVESHRLIAKIVTGFWHFPDFECLDFGVQLYCYLC